MTGVDKAMTASGRQSLSMRLRGDLVARIRAGEWSPGAPLPSGRTMAADTDVAVRTMRRAILSLVDEGLLRRRQGAGTFVRRSLCAIADPVSGESRTAHAEEEPGTRAR